MSCHSRLFAPDIPNTMVCQTRNFPLSKEQKASLVALYITRVTCGYYCYLDQVRHSHNIRSGFDCEILLIVKCEFLNNSQSKESQIKEYAMNITCNHTPSSRQAIQHSYVHHAFSHVFLLSLIQPNHY